MKIGFLAMSGVRINNDELLSLGLTLPGFVERSKVIASLPSLGLLTLAGLTPTSFNIIYNEIPQNEDQYEIDNSLDVVVISSYTAKIKAAYKIALRYLKNGVKVILGGLHVNAMPKEASLYASSIVLGEGELAWPFILKDLEKGSLKPIYDNRGKSFDLAKSKVPKYELLNIEKYNRLTLQTQRGCPYNCEFCASSIRLTPKYKTKPIQNIKDEIDIIKSIWKNPFIELADDNTFANKKHGKSVAGLFQKYNIKWFTETDISIAKDDDLLGLLRDSGCAQLLIGLESPDREGLKGIELNANWKEKQVEKYFEAIEKIQSYGISVNGCFILGLDGHDEKVFEDTLDFVKRSKLTEVQITLLTPFPGTPLYMRLLTEGRLLSTGDWENCTLFDLNFHPKLMTAKVLNEKFRWLMKEIYSLEMVAQRKKYFKELVRQKFRPDE